MRRIQLFLFSLFSLHINSYSATIYVDRQITADSARTYSVSARTQENGESIAYKSISAACNAAVAGDTVLIRQGTYRGAGNRIITLHSGTKVHPVVIRNYSNEDVLITDVGNNYPILIDNIEYIIVEGLSFNHVYAWGRIIDSNHIILRGNNFLHISSNNWLSLHFVNSNYNKVLNNNFYSPDSGAGKDNLQFVYSHHNLVAGNRIESIGHVLWAIKCGNFNVVRDNYFYNHNQKIGEVFDCDDGTPYTVRHKYVNATKYNLIENNIFAYTDKNRRVNGRPAGPFNGIQYAGQNGIIRRNVFYDNLGGGLGLTTYGQEAEYNTGNRVYNNTFYRNGFGGISISGSTRYAFSDNIIKNNIFFRNFISNWNKVYEGTAWKNADGKPIQILTGRRTGDYLVENNNIFDSVANQNHLIAQVSDFEQPDSPETSLQYWEKNYPLVFRNNIQADPLFENAQNHDFRLRPGSPMIDRGVFLTHTTSRGSCTGMQVEDVKYFYDGYDIEGEQGDMIMLENGGTARILSIDYTTNTLMLDRVLKWRKGQGVSLDYNGKAPDPGAFEYRNLQ